MHPKSILGTGCSAGGIGEELALALAKRGHLIFATARNPAKVPETLPSLSTVTVLKLDVSSTESVAAAAKTVTESGRGLDVLVNNAGCGYAQPDLDTDIARAQELFDTNLWGPVRMIQAFAGLLIASHGRIVNISTVGALINTPWICESADFPDLAPPITFSGPADAPRPTRQPPKPHPRLRSTASLLLCGSSSRLSGSVLSQSCPGS